MDDRVKVRMGHGETGSVKTGTGVKHGYGGLIVRRTVPGKTKQSSKTSMLRDNGSNVHHFHQCCGSTYLSPLTEASGTE